MFNLKNVYLVKDHLEALGAIEKDFVEHIEPPIFFEEFNKERFLKILKKIENFNEQNIGGLN